jgi:hypothetical protein
MNDFELTIIVEGDKSTVEADDVLGCEMSDEELIKVIPRAIDALYTKQHEILGRRT